jgi:hypothetical protein
MQDLAQDLAQDLTKRRDPAGSMASAPGRAYTPASASARSKASRSASLL